MFGKIFYWSQVPSSNLQKEEEKKKNQSTRNNPSADLKKKFLECYTFISCFLPSFQGNFFFWYNFKQENYKNSTRNSCIPFSKSYQLLNILAHLKNHSLIFLYTRFSLEPLRLRQYCSFHSQILHCIRTRSFSCIIHSSIIKPSTLTMI